MNRERAHRSGIEMTAQAGTALQCRSVGSLSLFAVGVHRRQDHHPSALVRGGVSRRVTLPAGHLRRPASVVRSVTISWCGTRAEPQLWSCSRFWPSSTPASDFRRLRSRGWTSRLKRSVSSRLFGQRPQVGIGASEVVVAKFAQHASLRAYATSLAENYVGPPLS